MKMKLESFKSELMVKLLFWVGLFFGLLLNYWPSFTNFFFGDDFFNFKLIDGKNFREILSFFNLFQKGPVNFLFYRPLTTQLFYWLGLKIFDFKPLAYHIVMFIFFVLSIFLVYFLSGYFFRDKRLPYLVAFFYAFSSSHFYRLFYLSQMQELGLAVFYLLSVIFFLKFLKRKKSYLRTSSFIFFILALLSKESAVTLPILLAVIIFYFSQQRKNKSLKNIFSILLPFLIIDSIYILARVFLFGFTRGGHYSFSFNPKVIMGNLLWYILWGIGFPEHFVNLKFFDLPTIINLEYFHEFGRSGARSVFFLINFILAMFLGIKLFLDKLQRASISKKRELQIIFFGGLWTILTLLPVLFFPFHKFAYSLTLPFFGICLILAVLLMQIFNFSTVLYSLTLLFYLLAFNFSLEFAFETHWSIKRAKWAEKIITYFKKEASPLEENKIYYFHDTSCVYCCQRTIPWSKEVAHILSNGKALEVYFNKNLDIKFQQFTPMTEIEREKTIFIYTGPFFNYEII